MTKDFLDTDHKISLDMVVKIINSEVQWCHAHPDGVSIQFNEGFIKGLLQAKLLIIEMAKKVEADK